MNLNAYVLYFSVCTVKYLSLLLLVAGLILANYIKMTAPLDHFALSAPFLDCGPYFH